MEGLSDSEAYFIRGAYYCRPAYAKPTSEEVWSDFAEATDSFLALMQVDPDHCWGNQFLQSALGALGRFQQSNEVQIKLAELLPYRVLNQQAAARGLQRRGDLARAEQAAVSLGWRFRGSRQIWRRPAPSTSEPSYIRRSGCECVRGF